MSSVPDTTQIVKGQLVMGTHFVSLDEKAFCLKELIERAPDSHGHRRMQCIQVIREDKIAELRRDLGPAENFTTAPFWLVTGGRDPVSGRIFCEYTVGEAVEMADQRRGGMHRSEEKPEPYDLIKGYYDGFDKQDRRRRGLSVFGYGGQTQRS